MTIPTVRPVLNPEYCGCWEGWVHQEKFRHPTYWGELRLDQNGGTSEYWLSTKGGEHLRGDLLILDAQTLNESIRTWDQRRIPHWTLRIALDEHGKLKCKWATGQGAGRHNICKATMSQCAALKRSK